MSEWFKEHDWKSCDGGESSAGSNPVLCAMKKCPPTGAFFHGAENSLLGAANYRRCTRDHTHGNGNCFPVACVWSTLCRPCGGKSLFFATSAKGANPLLGYSLFYTKREGETSLFLVFKFIPCVKLKFIVIVWVRSTMPLSQQTVHILQHFAFSFQANVLRFYPNTLL